MTVAGPPAGVVANHRDVIELDHDWFATATPPDGSPGILTGDGATWLPARVPGTVAAVLMDAGLEAGDLDADDWWFRTSFDARPTAGGESILLHLGGIATLAEVYLNGEHVLTSGSMYARHAIEIGHRLRATNEIMIRCRALGPELRVPRKPRARWRTRLVEDGNVRWFRTSILGRAPGFAPGPPVVGPWRPIWLERRSGIAVASLDLRPRLEGDDGVLAVRLDLDGTGGVLQPVSIVLDGPTSSHRASLEVVARDGGQRCQGELRVPHVRRWWPHTHGEPALYEVRFEVETDGQPILLDARRVGFRRLAAGVTADHDLERDGLDLHINDVSIFVRGAVWTPVDPIGLHASPAALRSAVEMVRDAGMNMLRLPGIGIYEDDAFHDLCDELGILVWQDLMFANMDYPFAEDDFRLLAENEARDILDHLAGRPSFAVLCGNSEVEQQVAMLGLDASVGQQPFFHVTVPALAQDAEADCVYVPSSPFGGDLPFRPDRGVANYYGVGGYRRGLSDARTSGVRFAAECLAFANVPDEAVVDVLLPGSSGLMTVDDPRWKAGVPRDVGSGWDFEDVRDHYLADLFGIVPGDVRRTDPLRYLELSRAVTGEIMAEVFGEWRRAASVSRGGLVLWLRDLVAGAGWGVIDHRGLPKVAYYHLRRALQPVAVWTTDEGLGGIVVHVANDRPEALSAHLRVRLYRNLETVVEEAEETIDLPPHSLLARDLETVLGRFVDAAWAYRFGPPGHDAIVATIERPSEHGTEVLSQAVRFPAGRPLAQESADSLGLAATATRTADGQAEVTITTRRLAYGVRIHTGGLTPVDNGFSLAPGELREIVLRAAYGDTPDGGGSVTALNLEGSVAIRWSADVR